MNGAIDKLRERVKEGKGTEGFDALLKAFEELKSSRDDLMDKKEEFHLALAKGLTYEGKAINEALTEKISSLRKVVDDYNSGFDKISKAVDVISKVVSIAVGVARKVATNGIA